MKVGFSVGAVAGLDMVGLAVGVGVGGGLGAEVFGSSMHLNAVPPDSFGEQMVPSQQLWERLGLVAPQSRARSPSGAQSSTKAVGLAVGKGSTHFCDAPGAQTRSPQHVSGRLSAMAPHSLARSSRGAHWRGAAVGTGSTHLTLAPPEQTRPSQHPKGRERSTAPHACDFSPSAAQVKTGLVGLAVGKGATQVGLPPPALAQTRPSQQTAGRDGFVAPHSCERSSMLAQNTWADEAETRPARRVIFNSFMFGWKTMVNK